MNNYTREEFIESFKKFNFNFVEEKIYDSGTITIFENIILQAKLYLFSTSFSIDFRFEDNSGNSNLFIGVDADKPMNEEFYRHLSRLYTVNKKEMQYWDKENKND